MLELFIGLVIASIVLGGTAYVLRSQLFMRRDSSSAIGKAFDGARIFGPIDRQLRLLKVRKEMSSDDRGLSDAYVATSAAMAICLTAAVVISSYAL